MYNGASPAGLRETVHARMALFDSLPADIRACLAQAAQDYAVRSLLPDAGGPLRFSQDYTARLRDHDRIATSEQALRLYGREHPQAELALEVRRARRAALNRTYRVRRKARHVVAQ